MSMVNNIKQKIAQIAGMVAIITRAIILFPRKIMQSNTRIIQPTREIICIFLLGFLLGVGGLSLLCQFNLVNLNSKQYAYVDVERVIESVNKSLNDQTEAEKLTVNQANDKLNIAKEKFNILLVSYSLEHDAVVFSSTKAIAGANNVTEYFIEEILEAIK